jgi:hypothetical protein
MYSTLSCGLRPGEVLARVTYDCQLAKSNNLPDVVPFVDKSSLLCLDGYHECCAKSEVIAP